MEKRSFGFGGFREMSQQTFNACLNHPIRLLILGDLLEANPRPIPWLELQRILGLSAGNLASHLRALERNKLIRIEKILYEARRPCTLVHLTPLAVEQLEKWKAWVWNNFFEGDS
jgi:DNA-binding MarR family transcriptional regulator